MVFFTCSSCGQSLKKNQVERHTYQCRGCQYVTCIDCAKDFWGNDYASHNSCITEDQRYGASSYIPKEFKGQKKQDAWISRIQESIAAAHNMNPQLKKLVEHIMRFDNVPRKKAKFINFLQNNNYKNSSLIEEAWNFIEKASKSDDQNSTSESTPYPAAAEETENQEIAEKKTKKQRKEERQQKQMKVEKKDKKRKARDEDEEEAENSSKKKKKLIKEEEDEDTNQENEEPGEDLNNSFNQESSLTKKSGAFSWKKAIAYVLQDAPEEGMKVKKLKRKLTALYCGTKCEEAARKKPEEIDALIMKKCNMRNDKYLFVKDRIRLRKTD